MVGRDGHKGGRWSGGWSGRVTSRQVVGGQTGMGVQVRKGQRLGDNLRGLALRCVEARLRGRRGEIVELWEGIHCNGVQVSPAMRVAEITTFVGVAYTSTYCGEILVAQFGLAYGNVALPPVFCCYRVER